MTGCGDCVNRGSYKYGRAREEEEHMIDISLLPAMFQCHRLKLPAQFSEQEISEGLSGWSHHGRGGKPELLSAFLYNASVKARKKKEQLTSNWQGCVRL